MDEKVKGRGRWKREMIVKGEKKGGRAEGREGVKRGRYDLRQREEEVKDDKKGKKEEGSRGGTEKERRGQEGNEAI